MNPNRHRFSSEVAKYTMGKEKKFEKTIVKKKKSCVVSLFPDLFPDLFPARLPTYTYHLGVR